MIIDCISDLHGNFPELEGGDLLIVGGDLTARHTRDEYVHFCSKIRHAGYRKVIVIAGNHDPLMQTDPDFFVSDNQVSYLCDSGIEFEGFKIWGSPWTKRFDGMNPACMAFTVDTDEELAEKWAMIPDDTDILITHSPEYGMLDCAQAPLMMNIAARCGSVSLGGRTAQLKQLKLHVVGHIHEGYGRIELNGYHYVNASHVNRRYKPINKPIRVELFGKTE